MTSTVPTGAVFSYASKGVGAMTCKDCERKRCPNRQKDKGCQDKVRYEETKRFEIYDHMMKQNRGIEGPM